VSRRCCNREKTADGRPWGISRINRDAGHRSLPKSTGKIARAQPHLIYRMFSMGSNAPSSFACGMKAVRRYILLIVGIIFLYARALWVILPRHYDICWLITYRRTSYSQGSPDLNSTLSHRLTQKTLGSAADPQLRIARQFWLARKQRVRWCSANASLRQRGSNPAPIPPFRSAKAGRNRPSIKLCIDYSTVLYFLPMHNTDRDRDS